MKPSPVPPNPYRGPNGEFRNVLTPEKAFAQPKPSVPYMVAGKDEKGRLYLDGKATLDNVFKNNPQMMQPAIEQAAKTRGQFANPSLSNYTGDSVKHPVILNPDKVDRSTGDQNLRRFFGRDNVYHSNADPRRNVPIIVDPKLDRANYSSKDDAIYVDEKPNASPFPRPVSQVSPPMVHVKGRKGVSQEPNPNRALFNGGAITWPRLGADKLDNVLFEEGTHAGSPTSYNALPKATRPDQFGPTDKLPGEPVDKIVDRARAGGEPTVPGMRGSYDQRPQEQTKARLFDQRDATATYGYRLQNSRDLEKYHRMLGAYGTDEEWKAGQRNLMPQHADSVGQVREQSKRQREQDYQRELKEYQDGKRPAPPVPVDQMPLQPPRELNKFIDQTKLMKQLVRQGPSVRPPLLQQPTQTQPAQPQPPVQAQPQAPQPPVPPAPALAKQARVASTLNSSYNRLMNEVRMTKIAAILQKATDDLKSADRPAGKRVQPPRVMSTPTSAELIQQKRESEGDMQAKQAYVVDYISFPADGTKQAYDLSGRMEAQAIMDRIYNEDPSYWPYGLGIPGHDGVYLIRDKMTKQAAGFVGWQQMLEGGRLIGSYSIGILPEYRGHGFAKEAVAKILREKAAGVDEVRSYVMPHNQKSKALAASLGVPVHEEF